MVDFQGYYIFVFVLFVYCDKSICVKFLNPQQLLCATCLQNKTIHKNLLQPVLHCRDEDSLTFVWNSTKTVFYSLEYQLQIETNKTFYSKWTAHGNETIRNLKAGTKYTFRLWSITSDKKFYNVSNYFNAITTYVGVSPLPVKDLHVQKPKFNGDSYSTVVKWKPNDDLPCSYELTWFGGSTLGEFEQASVKLKDPIRYTEVILDQLQFNTQYILSITSVKGNGFQESKEISKKFKTPSCLDTFKSVNNCIPAIPSGFKSQLFLIATTTKDGVVHMFFNINLSWSPPKYLPDNYTVDLFTPITVSNVTSHINLTVPGNSTKAAFDHIEIGMKFKISLTAWSKVGPSKPAKIAEDLRQIPTLALERYSTEPSPKVYTFWIVSLSVAVVFGVFSIVTVVTVRQCREKKERLKSKTNCLKDLGVGQKATLQTQPPLHTVFDKWEINFNNIVLKEQVGEGAFGVVRRAIFYKSNAKLEVAVKMLKDGTTREQIAQFYTEIKIMKSVPKHQNLVSLIGVVTQNRVERPYLVVEMCSKGDLLSCLKRAYARLGFLRSAEQSAGLSKDNVGQNQWNNNFYIQDWTSSDDDYFLNSKSLLSVARQICSGMEHLGMNKVVHRDLAARNILISKDNTVKVSDFGLSRDVYKNDVYLKTTGGKLPFRWMALESMTYQTYTTESDVWSFGIVLWEIVTLGRTPYPTVHTQELLLLLEHGFRMQRPNNCSNELYEIMKNCWHRNPKKRPTFTSLKKSFELFLENETEYLNLNVKSTMDHDNYQNIKNTQISSGKRASYSEYLKPVTDKDISDTLLSTSVQ